jgi:hypothetical protein
VPRPRLRDAQSEIDHLTDYVRVVANSVNLRDHTFDVRIGALPEGLRATCECVIGRRYAIITVREDFFELPAEDQREAILHEVIHPHVHPLAEHIQGLRSELGRAHFESVSLAFERDLERLVDSMTGVLCPKVPLPTW